MDKNRLAAYKVLLRMEENDTYSNIELNNQIHRIRPESQGFVRELVYGVTEKRLYLDYLLSQIVIDGYADLPSRVKVFLRIGIFQLVFMESVPEYAAVCETVNLAKINCSRHYKSINRILRTFIRKKK